MLIHLLCAHGTYVTALNGGGGVVRANADVAQNWEALELCDALGQAFGDDRACKHGFQVCLRTERGKYLLPDWGRAASATAAVPPLPAMIIRRAAGAGRVRDGDAVSFHQLLVGGGPVAPFWITAEQTLPRRVVANRQQAAPAAWETFTLIRQRRASVSVASDRAVPGGIPQVRVPDRLNEPRDVRATVLLSNPSPRGGTVVELNTSRQLAFPVSRVTVPEGMREHPVVLRVQRTDGTPSECGGRVSADVSARSTSSPRDGAASSEVQLVAANAHVSMVANEPLKREREGIILVQIKPNAPLAAGEYRVKLAAPANLMLVETPETRVRFEPGLAAAPVLFTVFPLAVSSAGVCVTGTVTGPDGRAVEQLRPFPVATS